MTEQTVTIIFICAWVVIGWSNLLYWIGRKHDWSLRSFAAAEMKADLVQSLGECVDAAIYERELGNAVRLHSMAVREQNKKDGGRNLTRPQVVGATLHALFGCAIFGPFTWFFDIAEKLDK